MTRAALLSFALLIPLFLSTGCGKKDKADDESEENGPGNPGNQPDDPSDPDNRYAKIADSFEALPVCDSENLGALTYALQEASFYLCDASGWKAIDLHGPKGNAGSPGAKGSKGNPGNPGSGGPALFEADGDFVGYLFSLNQNYALMENGLIAEISFTDGKILGGLIRMNAATAWAICHFESNDCTGTCYAPSDEAISPFPNAVFWTHAGLKKTTGNEPNVGAKTFFSTIGSNYACLSGGPSDYLSAIAVTEDAVLPPGLTHPFNGPLTIGIAP